MRIVLIFFSIFIVSHLSGQSLIQGKVIDSASQQSLANVSVFISNTSIGTITKQDGSFNINIPQGRYDIVFSYVGYTTKTFSTANIKQPLMVSLSQTEKQLADVVVIPFEKDGWQKWGKTFTELFIGTTDEANQCRIQNAKTLRFRYNKQDNTLTAVAFEPLIIINKALGYNLSYQLEDFVFDFKVGQLFYLGYPLFTEIAGNSHQEKRWQQRRKNVYEGSEMHFMRSLYRNTIAQEGFDVYRMLKRESPEKQRIKAFLKSNPMPADSITYFEDVLSRPDEKPVIYSGKLTGDSIAFAVNNITAGFQFDNYLYIVYNKKRAPQTYLRYFPDRTSDMASELNMLQQVTIEIEANGHFAPAQSLLSSGYWGWSEKISTLLSLDYKYVK